MEKWFAWIKNHIFMVILIMLFLIIGIPFIIYISFKIPAPIHLLEAGPGWNEGVVLGYYGSILGFCGTVVLSVLALYQNQEIKKETDKRTEILERQIHSPELKLEFATPVFRPHQLNFTLKNISDNLVNNIVVSKFDLRDATGALINMPNNAVLSGNSLGGGESLSFYFIAGEIKGVNLELVFRVSCHDKFKKEHQYKAIISVANAKLFHANVELNKIQD